MDPLSNFKEAVQVRFKEIHGHVSIGSYTGTGTTVQYGLGVTPDMIVVKTKNTSKWEDLANYSGGFTVPDSCKFSDGTLVPNPIKEFDKEIREKYPTLEKAYQKYLNIRRLIK